MVLPAAESRRSRKLIALKRRALTARLFASFFSFRPIYTFISLPYFSIFPLSLRLFSQYS